MGSPLHLTAPASEIDAAWPAVVDIFDRAEHDLTRFDAGSALSRLNAAAGGTAQPVPRLLALALAAAERAYRFSGGIFDPRIIGALEAAGEHGGVALPSSPTELRPNVRWLRLDSRRKLATVDAPVDLGGIGKGLALRWAAHRLCRLGLRAFLLEAGGDLVASGAPGPTGWTVTIEQPGGRDPAAVIAVRDGAVATSSVTYRRWTGADGATAHHLIDPRSGGPAVTDVVSVTVGSSDPAWAEVRAKVILIGGGMPAAPPVWRIDSEGRLASNDAAALRTLWRRPGTPRASSK